jgi:two-component system cell cycle sensor histidine kinase/response regulator CckA
MGLEETLENSPGAYQSIFENTGTAMVVVDEDMRIMLVNSELERMSGFSKRELEGGKLWTDFICAEDLERMKDYHRRRRSGEAEIPSSYTFRFLDKQNCVRDVSISVTLLPGTRRSIASIIDISGMKRVERELRESEHRYRALVEDMPALICRFRSDGVLTFVNRAYGLCFNRSADELLGDNFFKLIPGEERERVRSHFQSLTPASPLIAYEHKVIDRKGEMRWQQWTGRGIFSEAGELIEFQSLGQDITERRRAEQEKEKIQVRLQQTQRMEAVGRLTAGFAHDCNNILTVILGFSDILLSRIEPRHELRPALESIMGAAKRGEALTKKLLAFSRKQVLHPELLDVNALIGGMEEMLRRLVGADIELRIVKGGDLPAVNVDRVQLEQVIMNLAINARDAMPDGGRLRICTRTVRRDAGKAERPKSSGPQACVSITVSDTGTGMDKEILSRIFEPFYTTKEEGRGTGLGLSTAYGIVKQSGGFIQVKSSPGKGSTFRVNLPACPGGVAKREEELPDARQTACGETVLVAEDDESVLALLDNLLRKHGYAVLPARQGSEALAHLESHHGHIDLLIADLVMPGMNGRELAEKVKAVAPDTKVLYISGYQPDSIPVRELPGAERDYLPKPFSATTLLTRIRELLD